MNTPRRFATPALLLATLALTSCATIAGTVGESFTTALVGGQEVPGPGDPQATGTAKVTADSATDTVCADVRTQRLAPATAAHIHRGARGVAGPPVLTLDTPTAGRSNKCYSVDKALAAAILADPAGYYVNIHTAQFPKGAIRGQVR